MMFEGVSKDDVNYHMIIYYREDEPEGQGERKLQVN